MNDLRNEEEKQKRRQGKEKWKGGEREEDERKEAKGGKRRWDVCGEQLGCLIACIPK